MKGHRCLIAQTRYGKSEYERRWLIEKWFPRKLPALVIDPPGTLVEKLVSDLGYAGRLNDVILVQLRDTNCTVGFDWIVPSTNPDLMERRKQNEDVRERFKRMLLFRRGAQDTTKTPIIEVGLNAACDILLNQDRPCPPYWVLKAFEPGTAEQDYLLAHCTDKEVKRRFCDWNEMSWQRRRDECGPALRILEAFLARAVVLAHTGKSFDPGEWWDAGKIILVDGSMTEPDPRNIMSMAIIQMAFDHCWKRRPGQTWKDLRVVIDEATALTDLSVATQLREIAKQGCFIDLLFQNPMDFATPQIRNEVFGNTEHWWGRLGNPDAAQFAAEDVGTFLLDDSKVWYTEERIQQLHDGYDLRNVKSTNLSRDESGRTTREGESHSTQAMARFRQEKQTSERRKPYDMQIAEVKQMLMGLRPGQYMYRGADGVTPAPVYAPLLPEPWAQFKGLPEAKRAKYVAQIKARDIYRKPVIVVPPCLPKTNEDAASRLDAGEL